MIKSFKQSYLEEFWNNGKHKRIPTHLENRVLRKLDMLNATKELRDLNSPPSNHLHPLHKDIRRPREAALSIPANEILAVSHVQGASSENDGATLAAS